MPIMLPLAPAVHVIGLLTSKPSLTRAEVLSANGGGTLGVKEEFSKDSDWGLVGSGPEKISEDWFLGSMDKEPCDATVRVKAIGTSAIRLAQDRRENISLLCCNARLNRTHLLVFKSFIIHLEPECM